MDILFESVHNHHEQAVFQLVRTLAPRYAALEESPELLADVACVALNRLPARYIRHSIDLNFYTTDRERQKHDTAILSAVKFAFNFVQSRASLPPRARTP